MFSKDIQEEEERKKTSHCEQIYEIKFVTNPPQLVRVKNSGDFVCYFQ